MKIVSKFHDYYDGVQALGQDRTLVYPREQRELSPAEAGAYQCPWSLDSELLRAKGFALYFSPFWVAVAGKRYRGMRARKKTGATPPCFTDAYFYSLDGSSAYAEKLTGFDPFAEERSGRRHRRYRWSWEADRIAAAEWFGAQGTEELHPVMAERGHAIVSGVFDHRLPQTVLNPRLADFQFAKVLDPYRIFQELSMWLGGVLPGRDAMTARVSDADRFIEHGFDTKTSFRGQVPRASRG